MYLLDTNACIRILNDSSPRLVDRLRDTNPDDIRLSAVTRAELLFGAHNSTRIAGNLRLLDAFFKTLFSLPFDDACADRYGVLRAELAATGQLIGPNDLFIASTALAHNLVLVTHNVREFSRVPGLRLEDWEE